jgi:Ca2+-binding EF-hand superfamily protein
MNVIPSVKALLLQGKDTIKMFEEGEVRPNFYKYDADQSGTIDRGELMTCLKDLGYDLDENELEKAFSNLDINGDGVIDYNEFRVWFLNGQQDTSVARKVFTKFAGTSLSFLKNKGSEINTSLKKS